jgi:peptidylprolyl isomerase
LNRLAIACLAATLLGMPLAAQKAPKVKTTKGKTAASTPKKEPTMITTPSGLQYLETAVGTGACPTPGQTVLVHYTGWLSENGSKGKKFDSSLDRGEALAFPVGTGRVIKGWDEGLLTMKLGGKRTLIIPADLGYGARGAGGGVIPANATLIFDVELVGLK